MTATSALAATERLQDVHDQAMRISPEQATKIFACVTIDEASFRQHNELQAGLRVRGFRKQVGLEWQFDGQIYPLSTDKRKGPLLPGEKVWVPLIVAQFGVRNTAVWEYETDAQGNIINKQDFLYGQQVPRLKIIEIRDPGDFAKQMEMPAQVLAACPFCEGEFQSTDLGNHMAVEHGDEIVAARTAVQPANRPAARAAVRQWAEKAAKQGAGLPDAG